MNRIIEAPFIREVCKLTANLYRLGWDERNGGNVSLLLTEDDLRPYQNSLQVLRTLPAEFDGRELAGRYFLVSGTGKYFKNVMDAPEENLGILRITEDGSHYDLLWGYADGGKATSELPAHLMSHIERLKADPEHRVVIHTHATNVIAMTFVHDLSPKAFTRTLWQMCTECMVVFPDGVAVLPWMLCGNDAIGRETAVQMREHRLVIWGMHGIFGTGRSIDEAFGLIETVEKAAEIYIKIMNMPLKQTITDAQLKEIADAFGVTPKAGYLSL